jgi:hypothetical protein
MSYLYISTELYGVMTHKTTTLFDLKPRSEGGKNFSTCLKDVYVKVLMCYLRTMLTDQNYIQEEIKSRLKLGNASYHSVQNVLSSRLLSKNLKIKIYRTIILSVVFCMGVKPGR